MAGSSGDGNGENEIAGQTPTETDEDSNNDIMRPGAFVKELRYYTKHAHCHGWIIDRGPIRLNFYTEMDEVCSDMSEYAFTLFDRYGCLRADLINHPKKREPGCGVRNLIVAISY